MRIAALYDIHGNLPALEAVLQETRRAGVDVLVLGGDVLPGPMPTETLACLLDLDIPIRCIRGNGELAVLEEIAGKEPIAIPEPYRPVIRWTAQQLHPEHVRWLSTWPKILRVEIAALGKVLFCHATPRDENECFTRLTPEESLRPVFDGVDASVVVCGHTHMQFDRTIEGTRVVNAGSAGMPFGKPGADWLLLGPGIQFQHTDYDLEEARERILTTNYPGAQNFVTHNLLQVPSETEMLEAFSRAG